MPWRSLPQSFIEPIQPAAFQIQIVVDPSS
jgi:hypothetical protein